MRAFKLCYCNGRSDVFIIWQSIIKEVIYLQRKTPEQLAYYEVMLRRSSAPDEYAKLYVQAKSGYIGERRLDREWRDANIRGHLLHDFTCFNAAGHSHQMDTVFICKHFILVVEVKNITGHIHFNLQTRQLVRHRDDGVIEAFTNPIDQVKRHRALLEDYLMFQFDYVPVEAAVVMTNPQCVIGETGNEIPIFAVNGLRSVLDGMIARHQHISLNPKLIRTSLEKLYRPLTAQPWRKNVPIRTGVLCMNCNGKMRAVKSGFKCLQCNSLDSTSQALRRTLHDYRILFGATISNYEFREFAEITSRHTAYGILNRLLVDKKIAGRSSKYVIPEDIFQSPNQLI